MTRTSVVSISLLCALLLAGCAAPATGLRSGEKDIRSYLAERPAVPPGKARVVVYAYQGVGTGWNHASGVFDLDINGKRIISKLGNTRYDGVIVDAGPAKVTAGGESDLGNCIQSYFFPADQTTFIKISMRESQQAAAAVFGLLGSLIESAAAKSRTDCGGSYKTELVPYEQAVAEITKIGK